MSFNPVVFLFYLIVSHSPCVNPFAGFLGAADVVAGSDGPSILREGESGYVDAGKFILAADGRTRFNEMVLRIRFIL